MKYTYTIERDTVIGDRFFLKYYYRLFKDGEYLASGWTVTLWGAKREMQRKKKASKEIVEKGEL